MTSLDELRITRLDSDGARAIAHRLTEVYADVYADRIANPFFSVERFAQRLDNHLRAPGYALVIAELAGTLTGYAYGATLRADTLWWNGMREPLPPAMTRETGRRTFALNEIMVRAPWRRHGIGRRLHDALLNGRSEERATLLVEQGNEAANAAYRRWGWRRIGYLQPFPDAPVYASMLLDLRPADPSRA
jgi:GNAT superfamily N-acetyltransferase